MPLDVNVPSYVPSAYACTKTSPSELRHLPAATDVFAHICDITGNYRIGILITGRISVISVLISRNVRNIVTYAVTVSLPRTLMLDVSICARRSGKLVTYIVYAYIGISGIIILLTT